MRDPRIDALARILVRYSTRVGEGDTCVIQADVTASPLILAVYEEVLKTGGHPVMALSIEGEQERLLELASDAQLDWIAPPARWVAEQADCRIAIGAESNTRELSAVDPERQTRRQSARRELMESMLSRAAAGEHRWVYTMYPTAAYASDAEMSLRAFEDFYLGACLADDPDPLGAWERESQECRRLAEWIEGRSEVHIKAPGTDIRLGIEGRHFIPCTGEHNMPDGEFFTGPVEDSVEGVVRFDLPAMVGGREIAGVTLRFESGRVVDASAERGEEYLVRMLDTDEGARTLGELGIGTNYRITRGTKGVLLDEKIGGTVHMAVGASYPESGGTNQSAVHTDLVCELRQGGTIEVDGEVMQRDGKFVV